MHDDGFGVDIRCVLQQLAYVADGGAKLLRACAVGEIQSRVQAPLFQSCPIQNRRIGQEIIGHGDQCLIKLPDARRRVVDEGRHRLMRTHPGAVADMVRDVAAAAGLTAGRQ